MRHFRAPARLLLTALGALILANFASAQQATLKSLEVSPPSLALYTSQARQTFVVQATYSDGLTQDVTGSARATLLNASLAKLDKNVLTPLADGTTQLKVAFGGKDVAVPLKVVGAKKLGEMTA